MQVLADDGTRIVARVNGRQHRNAVVLIHGFPFSSHAFDAQADALAERYCVVLPDLRGSGESGVSDGPYLMETLAADVALVLDALGIERANVVGHSMGGYVALAFARMFSERVERLALIASRLRADTESEAAARNALAERVDAARSIEPAVEAYLPRLLSPTTLAKRPEVVENAYSIARANPAAGAAATLRGMALRVSSDDIAEDLTVPMLAIAGGEDRVVTLEEARSVASSFANGRLVVCETSGHLPMMEEPARVNDALQRLLEERGVPGASA